MQLGLGQQRGDSPGGGPSSLFLWPLLRPHSPPHATGHVGHGTSDRCPGDRPLPSAPSRSVLSPTRCAHLCPLLLGHPTPSRGPVAWAEPDRGRLLLATSQGSPPQAASCWGAQGVLQSSVCATVKGATSRSLPEQLLSGPGRGTGWGWGCRCFLGRGFCESVSLSPCAPWGGGGGLGCAQRCRLLKTPSGRKSREAEPGWGWGGAGPGWGRQGAGREAAS